MHYIYIHDTCTHPNITYEPLVLHHSMFYIMWTGFFAYPYLWLGLSAGQEFFKMHTPYVSGAGGSSGLLVVCECVNLRVCVSG